MQKNIMPDASLEKLKRDLRYRFSELLHEVFIEPHWIYISLTHQCNNACVMCGVRHILKDKQLPGDLIRRLLEEISSWKSDQVVVFTGGEPFLRRDTLDLVAKSVSLGIATELVSNGSLIDEGLAGRIVRSGLKNVAISLDGARAQTHDAIRGRQGSHDEALRALRLLSKSKKDSGPAGPQISAWVTVMDQNMDELNAIAQLTKSVGVECLVYHPVIALQEDMQRTKKEGSLWVAADRLEALRLQMGDLLNLSQTDRRIAFLHDPYLFLDYFRGDLKRSQWKCNPFEFLNIGPDGQVSSCGEAFGSILKMSLGDCLRTKDADAARKKMALCPQPCLQTCWARPEADSLEKVIDVFCAALDSRSDLSSHAKTALLGEAFCFLDEFEKTLKKRKAQCP